MVSGSAAAGGSKVFVEVAERAAELNTDELVGEGGQSNVVWVALGLAGKGESSISRVSRPSRLSEIGRGNASENEKLKR